MKISIITLLISLNIFASFFVENCSNADSSFNSISGHLPSRTSYRVIDSRTGEEKRVNLIDFNAKTLSSSTIKESSRTVCSEGSSSGYIQWTKFNFVKKIITLGGQEKFPSTLEGVSEDQKSLTVDLLCKFEGNSRASCQK